MKHVTAIFLIVLLAACNGNDDKNDPDIEVNDPVYKQAPQLSYNIVNVYPHDTAAYTQGLELHKGKMYEGTGDYANSTLRITNFKTGSVEKKYPMGSDKIFGEGITILNGKVYQLTWQSNIVYVYDVNNINKPLLSINWPYEGWGLTNDGAELIISDGSSNLYFVSPNDLKVRKRISVNEDGVLHDNLNELELVNGSVYANVYGKDVILKIDTASGNVTGKLTLPADLITKYADGYVPEPGNEVLNGIAYDSTTKKFFITGKRWPKMFEMTIE
jgi:glutaminyl-peptide cyclotransferase